MRALFIFATIFVLNKSLSVAAYGRDITFRCVDNTEIIGPNYRITCRGRDVSHGSGAITTVENTGPTNGQPTLVPATPSVPAAGMNVISSAPTSINTAKQWLGEPFQIWIYFIASIIGIVLDYVGIIGASIRHYNAIFDSNFLEEHSSLAKETKAKQHLSDAIGFMKRKIYLYCFFSGKQEFVGAILLFKAFSGWLYIVPRFAGNTVKQKHNNQKRTRSQENLIIFY